MLFLYVKASTASVSDENNLNLTPTTNLGDEGSTKEYIVKFYNAFDAAGEFPLKPFGTLRPLKNDVTIYLIL